MQFINVLNNPEARAIVHSIEDLLGSLEGREGQKDLTLFLEAEIADLKALTGFEYIV
jgi:hypothetical protein